MKERFKLIRLSCVFYLIFLWACQPREVNFKEISSDPQDIKSGAQIFAQYCSACHSFVQDGIGPNLAGLTREMDRQWISDFIRNPRQMINSNDPRATEIFAIYNTFMPPFQTLTDEEIDQTIAYIHTFEEKPAKKNLDPNLILVEDPIADTIAVSDVIYDLELIRTLPSSSEDLPLARINKMDCEPISGRLFIVDQRGKLYDISNDESQVYLDISETHSQFIDQPGLGTGFGSFAFHPEYFVNGLLYTTHTESSAAGVADFTFEDSINVTLQWVLTEWKAENPASNIFEGTHREILRINFVTGLHGVQEITFNPHAKQSDQDFGKLYVAVGDGGSVEHGYPHVSLHDGTRVWSSILRIDPLGKNSKNGQYGIPDDNPFAGDGSGRVSEIWAYGFRNPHRITWDQQGRMLATDIGARQIEEINLILPGEFYGWPIREGTFLLDYHGILGKVYELPADDSMANVAYPVVQYDHDKGRAISGGYAYYGDELIRLKGKYVFGDMSADRLFFSDLDAMQLGSQARLQEWKISFEGKLTNFKELCQGCGRIELRLGRDCTGNLYVFTKSNGKLYRIRGPAI